MSARQIWTVGHSNREIEGFLSLLREHSIELVADVRRFPASRRQPQFGAHALRAALAESDCEYRHFENLGGRRNSRMPDSPNGGWRVESFNAYADYMLTEPFGRALEELTDAAGRRRTAIMCAEALPWRCHRRLIADALIVRGWTVWDILSEKRADQHALTDFAEVEGDRLSYP